MKESVFPFDRFPGEDVIGPEMKSTGEVMGIDKNFPVAYIKSQIAAGNKLPLKVWFLFRLETKIKKIYFYSPRFKKLILKFVQLEVQRFSIKIWN